MMLDVEFTKNILLAFQEHDDSFMPVALVAKNIGDKENLESEDQNQSKYCLSGKLVFHLLHLQDLGCIRNMKGECSWGYIPTGSSSQQIHEYIENSLETGQFETPHQYEATTQNSVIRLTATGIQMLEVLQQSKVSENLRKLVVEFGKAAIPEALGAML